MKIRQTRNYSEFVHDETNRPITERDTAVLKRLEESMKKYGFLPFPILVKRSGARLKIVDGQHRFAIAQKLGLSVLYVETDRDDIVIADCAAAQTPWKVFDYIATFATQGNKHYQHLIEFSKETQLPIVQCAHLLFGEVSHGGKVQGRIRDGVFVVKDVAYARRVAALVNAVRRHVPWALNANCVGAISRFVRVDQFDDDQFVKKVDTHPHMLRRCPTLDMFSDMFDELYNYAARTRIPLAFHAKEVAAARFSRKGCALHHSRKAA